MPVAEIYIRETTRTFEVIEIEPADPFGIDDPCPMNAGGPHADVVECNIIACARCTRIIWS